MPRNREYTVKRRTVVVEYVRVSAESTKQALTKVQAGEGDILQGETEILETEYMDTWRSKWGAYESNF